MQDDLHSHQKFTAILVPPLVLLAAPATGRIRSTSWRACEQRG
jgi:hypothetical protein